MYWATSSHLSPFSWANRCEENNDLATSPYKTLLLKVLETALLAIWGEAIPSCSLSAFLIYSRLNISWDRGTDRHSATNGGAEQPQMRSEALWSYNANEAQNQSGRCFSQRLFRLVAADEHLSLLFFPQLFAPATSRLSASILSKEGQHSRPARLTTYHKLFAQLCPSPGTVEFQVLPPIAHMTNSLWHSHTKMK